MSERRFSYNPNSLCIRRVGDDGIITAIAHATNKDDGERLAECADALSGIPNPAEFVRAARELAAWFEHCGFNAYAHSSNCKCGGTSDGGKTWCGQQHEIVARLLAAGGGQ